ncbi:hypothetical protein J3R30DRAFT_3663430 [Lentinula aciculospora]|uniref:Enoyl reductase (ER) domain-containing protein n=1 Tax=Lentinula aciculospora TaxID=153920 RepID=A0A9W8ZUT2_9AGAR|nr:hypothetical protein J3R30DRAFT_3663430 [Lentinula aciculospora]
MAPIANPRVVFIERLTSGLPVAGKHFVLDTSRTIDIENVPLNGGYLTKTLVLSPEPAMRERMRDPSVPSYTTTYTLGASIVAFAVVVVVRSEKESIKVGEYMYGQTPWEGYTVQPYTEVVPDPKGTYPLSKYTNIMGTPGLTAFVGMEGIIEGKEGETLFVSSGASGVGSLVIQLAKMNGLRVIASAGSDAKVEYMRSLGVEVPFNYNKESYESVLSKHGPIHAFWDNVGAEALDAALDASVAHGRFAICGTVATDNVQFEERYRLKNAFQIMKKRITIRGFIVPDLIPQFGGRFFQEVPALVAQGKLQSEETIIGEKWEDVPEAIIEMMSSGHGHAGKPVIVVAQQ